MARNWDTLRSEPGNPLLLALYCIAVQFLATFGVSDYAIHLIVLRKLRLVEDVKLPGTMLVACVVPQMVMALCYVATLGADMLTLAVAVLSAIAGAKVGVHIVTRIKPEYMKLVVGAALLIAAVSIMLSRLGVLAPLAGDDTYLRGVKLVLLALVIFTIAAISMSGVPTLSLKLIGLYALGLDAKAIYPYTTGSATFALGFGGVEYIKKGMYNRKLALISSLTGSLGVVIAVFAVRSMDTSALQWIIAAVALYSGAGILLGELRAALRERRGQNT